MIKRKLGKDGLEVSALGLGCMGMSSEGADDNESLKTLRHAIEQGVTFLDTADMYGQGHNETLIGKFLAEGYRDRVVIATKCGFVFQEDGKHKINGSPEYIKAACDASLKRLNIDTIDLYYLHRADRDVPIEDSMAALASLVKAGKVRYLGLSEVTPQTLRRAAKIHPIAALQSEYSLWHRKPEHEILSTCRELGIGFVPFSPLGRGFLTGKIKDLADLGPNDFRRTLPRFQTENLQNNLKIADIIVNFANQKKCTPAQLAIAWVLAQDDDIVPIPGTKSINRFDENLGAIKVKLSKAELEELNRLIPSDIAAGAQFPEYLDFEV